jgi:hypothetical protein
MRAAIATLILGLLAAVPAGAQAGAPESLDSLTARARTAISQSAFDAAVKILTEAKKLYPASPKPGIALGDLYYDKELYPLALDEYRAAEALGADDFSTLTQIARCYGKLNREKDSISWLTRILKEYPDSADTVDDLGWMYFKTHQLEKGEQVLREGIDRLGMRRGLAMTLGTVYSGMNRYDASRQYYLRSIDEAIAARDRDFAAIAYYNLSLLEHNFFHYNSALRYTDDSLAQEDRPSGHLARGELFEQRMDFPGAEREYMDAYAKDTTPLSKVNLANLYQVFGRLDLARRYGEEVLASRNLAWLLYYGTDTARHFQDLHELLTAVYEGLARREAHRPTTGVFDRTRALFDAGRYALLSWYHRQRFRLSSLAVGQQYLNEGSQEEAWWEFYQGNDGYREVALKYLGLARDLETARTPHAGVFYQLEEGKVDRSPDLVRAALDGFDPFWEKKETAEALVTLIRLLPGRAHAAERGAAIVRLYAINPGALPQAGIGLPLSVELSGPGWTGRERATITRFLRRAGSDVGEGAAYSLSLARDATGDVRWSVYDQGTRTEVHGGKTVFNGRTTQRCALLVQTILEDLYSVH